MGGGMPRSQSSPAPAERGHPMHPIRQETKHVRWLLTVVVATGALAICGAGAADYREVLTGPSPSLSLNVEGVDPGTGTARVNGVDTRRPTTPFAWDWGDGTRSTGFFPQSHSFTSRTTNYVVRVTAFYGSGQTGEAKAVIRFVPPRVRAIELPSEMEVTVPPVPVALASRQPGYGFSSGLSPFPESQFTSVPRAVIEQVLSVAAAIQADLMNGDFSRPEGAFRQVVLRDNGGGFYSLWYATPVAFAAGNTPLGQAVPWTSCFHEMGHNITLNSPANFRIGGRLDGMANAVVSESLAQIFQHVTGALLVDFGAEFGLSSDLNEDIWLSVRTSMGILRSAHDRYVGGNALFQSWNDPATQIDETVDTFMTISCRFFLLADQDGRGYRLPLKRLMQVFQLFDADWLARYDPGRDTAAAQTFRASLWVAALSHAFGRDLRAEFRALRFPVDDGDFDRIAARTAGLPPLGAAETQVGIRLLPGLTISGPAPRFHRIEYSTDAEGPDWTPLTNVFVPYPDFLWVDRSAAGARRFYRAVLLP